jgi:hypothetical protein
VPILMLGLHRFNAGTRVEQPPGHRRVTAPTTPSAAPPPLPADEKHSTTDFSLLHILLGVGIAAAVVLLVMTAIFLWRRLNLPERSEPTGTFSAVEDERQRLAEAVDSGWRALREDDDVRRAIIACYAAMEESLAASGVARMDSDSPQDLLERAAERGVLTDASASALTQLFREARYSTHPMTTGHRDRAIAALTEIAARLEAQRAAGPAAGARPTAEAAS